MNLLKPHSIWQGERLFILLMLAPAMALLFAFTIAPFAISVWLSFTDYLLSRPPARFIGLSNYIQLFTSAAFWSAFWISVLFTTLTTLVETVIGVAIATLLVGARRTGGFLRTIYMLPLAVTPIAIIFTFRMMFNPGLGIINYLFRLIGLPPQDWLGDSTMAMISLVTVDVWQWTPLTLLIVAGGLAALPTEPLEAARIDGATGWQSFRYVTLPMLMPFVALAVLFRAVDAFKTFDLIYVLTGGGPGTSTTTLNVMAFKQAIEFTELGRGSATAIIVMIIITLASQFFLRRSKLLTVPEVGA
ncbi:sugar ABC transporter permease [Acidisoma cellulosilytica]|uniref:Sugar ABC transporter permease n=1 Tax=Acidisoma cellulosilyticum TaxID=2802395 RepID=A0A963Z0D1_9PROT|nr:sugar ABC transporter permease [Acidisoma cellulosilyticum]MCB8880209.1 sugar ABC transporter permease [Acidisoma cellulosilyticum]